MMSIKINLSKLKSKVLDLHQVIFKNISSLLHQIQNHFRIKSISFNANQTLD